MKPTTLLPHAPRSREGKWAMADIPKLCKVADFPTLCDELKLFSRRPDVSTVRRWIARGSLPTMQVGGSTVVRVHKYLSDLGLLY